MHKTLRKVYHPIIVIVTQKDTLVTDVSYLQM